MLTRLHLRMHCQLLLTQQEVTITEVMPPPIRELTVAGLLTRHVATLSKSQCSGGSQKQVVHRSKWFIPLVSRNNGWSKLCSAPQNLGVIEASNMTPKLRRRFDRYAHSVKPGTLMPFAGVPCAYTSSSESPGVVSVSMRSGRGL